MITWPDLVFPPINLWNVPYQNFGYRYEPRETKTREILQKTVQVKQPEYLYGLRKNN